MSLISDKQVEQFNEEGYFVTPPVFDPQLLSAMRGEFQRLWDDELRAAEMSGDERQLDLVRHRPFLIEVHKKSTLCAEFVKAPIYLEACARFVGPDADLYFNQAVMKPPETGRLFGWHQDSGYQVTVPLNYITCWTAISRSTVDNGCIWVIPGSHKRGLLPHQRNAAADSIDAILDDESGAIPVEMEAGQVAIFSSLMLHKSGANISNEVRMGYVPQYHVPHATTPGGETFGDYFPILRDGKVCGK